MLAPKINRAFEVCARCEQKTHDHGHKFQSDKLNFLLYLAHMQVKLLDHCFIAVALATTTPRNAYAQYAFDYGFAAGTGNYPGTLRLN